MKEKFNNFIEEKIIMKHLKKESSPVDPKNIIICSCIACIFSFFGIYIIPLIGSIAIIVYQYYLIYYNSKFYDMKHKEEMEKAHLLEQRLEELNTEKRQAEIEILNKRKDELTESIKSQQSKLRAIADECTNLSQEINMKKAAADAEIELEISKKREVVQKEAQKISKFRELYKSMKYSIENFLLYDPSKELLKFTPDDLEEVSSLVPSVMLRLQYMNSKELRKAYKENDKQIEKIMKDYSSRYTTKANQAIYSLMVIALRAELQNILSELKYDKLDVAIENIKKTTLKYLKIAGDGNQSIVGTLTKFISQLEYLFINAAKIEYNYYIKKEKEKQEQLALKEKMREEAAERKALENERKKIEQEEAKFKTEIDKIKEQLQNAAQEDMEVLNRRILELQSQLSDVIVKKEDIINLQNGKAGTVYIISNLGSFGDDIFKIGMTRRLEPQDRINELGSASVPFKFDVHSFIFSEDAVSLEKKIHEMLTEKRVNKINLRKEFFKVSIDDLEKLVEEIEPTAEFNRTMLANEYRASLDTNDAYIESTIYDDTMTELPLFE